MLVIVDDNVDLLEALKQLFSITHEVSTFPAGKPALEFVKENIGKVSVCILDYAMPEMNGIELARKIKAVDKDIFIIMMSGFVDFEKVEPFLKERLIYQFFTKPLNIPSLVKTADEASRLYQRRRTF
jgi:Response regulator containing CheY-like receiver, AAA-type ATPase, and DNA-binding domains